MSVPKGFKRSEIDVARKTVAARRRALEELPFRQAREAEALPSKHAAQTAEKERVLAIAERALRHLEDAEAGHSAVVIGVRP